MPELCYELLYPPKCSLLGKNTTIKTDKLQKNSTMVKVKFWEL